MLDGLSRTIMGCSSWGVTTGGGRTKPQTNWHLHVSMGLALVASLNIGCGSKSSGPSTSAVIGPAGGTLTMADGSSLMVPPGALPSPTTITMTAVTLPTAINNTRTGSGVIGQAYQLSPEGLLFAVPAIVTIAVTPAQRNAGLSGGDSFPTTSLQMLTTAVGTTDHAYVLNTSAALDASHVGAAIIHFSDVWLSVVPGAGSIRSASSVSNGCQGGPGGAHCVSFSSSFPCPSCQCFDGTACPGGGMAACPTIASYCGGSTSNTCSGPNAKSPQNGYICVGAGQQCAPTSTLPCCTDECADNAGTPEPGIGWNLTCSKGSTGTYTCNGSSSGSSSGGSSGSSSGPLFTCVAGVNLGGCSDICSCGPGDQGAGLPEGGFAYVTSCDPTTYDCPWSWPVEGGTACQSLETQSCGTCNFNLNPFSPCFDDAGAGVFACPPGLTQATHCP